MTPAVETVTVEVLEEPVPGMTAVTAFQATEAVEANVGPELPDPA